jgi:NitT/TauT family transport system permease protein
VLLHMRSPSSFSGRQRTAGVAGDSIQTINFQALPFRQHVVLRNRDLPISQLRAVFLPNVLTLPSEEATSTMQTATKAYAVPEPVSAPVVLRSGVSPNPALSAVAIGGGAGANAAAAAAPPRVPAPDLSRFKQWLEVFLAENAITLLSMLSLVGLWYLASFALPPSIMPAPHVVADILWTQMQAETIWSDVTVTLGRIAAAFSIAMVVSLIAGFAMGISRTVERFLDVWVICLLTLPSLVLMLTIYMVVGLNDRAAVLGAAIPVIPILTINIWQGVKGVEYKLIDMAKAYHATRGQIIRSVIAPQIAPVIVASARFGLGLAWKMVLFVELIGRSDGIGYRIEFYYQMFNMGAVLAHALLFLFIMLFLEVVVLGMLERRLFRWRPAQRQL